MKINGNLQFLGLGQIEGLRVENLALDPVAPAVGQVWYHTGDKVYRGFDGASVITFAMGGNTAAILAEVDAIEASVGLNSDGTMPAITGTSYINNVSDFKAALIALDTATKSASDAAASEATRAQGAESTLQSNIDAEATRAQGAESTLTTNLNAEVTNRTNADTTLQGNIDAEVTRAKAAEAAVQSNLDTEVTNRTNADNALGTRVDGVAADLATETTNRTNADTALGSRIDGVVSSVTSEQTRAEAAETNLQNEVDAKVSKAGDSMTGNLAMNGNTIVGLGAPVSAADAATKNYVDSLVSGLSWLPPVDDVVANAAAVDLTGKADGYRIVDTTANKLFTVTAGALDAGVVLTDGQAFFHKLDEMGYVSTGATVVQFTGTGQVAAGVGLSKSGNQIDVNLGAGISQLPTDEVGVDVLGTGGLFLTVDGATASTDTAAQLAVKLADASLATTVDGVKLSNALQADIANTKSGLAQEITDRTNADTTLQGNINTVSTNLSSEVTRAQGAETTLQSNIDAEVSRAQGAESTLTNNLSTEVTNRTNADTTLQSNIDAEVTRAKAAEAAVQGNLDTEVTNRTNADANLQSQIDSLTTSTNTSTTNVNTRIDGGFFVYDGSTAATSHSVVHNIGSKYNNVTVVDASDQVVIPQSITFNDVNTLTVTFNTAITCKVIVSGLHPVVA